LDAWQNTGMATPYVMASTTWGQAPTPPTPDLIVNSLTTWQVAKGGQLIDQSTFRPGDTVAVKARTVDPKGAPLSGAQVFLEIRDASGTLVTSIQGFTDVAGEALLKWKTARNQAPGTYTAKVVNVLKNGYQFKADAGVTIVTFAVQ
jgi:hypothetical protein